MKMTPNFGTKNIIGTIHIKMAPNLGIKNIHNLRAVEDTIKIIESVSSRKKN